MLLLSLALHGWLLWAAPAPAILAPGGKVALSLGQLQLSSAPAAAEAADAPQPEPEKAAESPQPQASKPKVATKKLQTKKPVQPLVVAKREPTKTEQADSEREQEAASDAAAPTAKAPEIGASDEPLLVDTPAFASPPSPPTYPRLARQRRQQGTVVIEVQLGRGGEQMAREVLQSSGVDSLDKAALAAVKNWRFLPYRENDRPHRSRVRLPIRFAL